MTGRVCHPPRLQHLVEQAERAAVGVAGDEHAVARPAQRADQAVLGGHAGRERERPRAVLQRGQAGLQRGPGGVRGARVLVAAPRAADAVLLVGRGLVDRRDHRAGDRVRVLSRVDRQRLEAQLLRSRAFRGHWPPPRVVAEQVGPGEHGGGLAVDVHERRARLLKDRGGAADRLALAEHRQRRRHVLADRVLRACPAADQGVEQVALGDRAGDLGGHQRRLLLDHGELRDVVLAQQRDRLRDGLVRVHVDEGRQAGLPGGEQVGDGRPRRPARAGTRSRPSRRR